MITIKHGRAIFTVKPENAQQTHDLLATIDKTKGRRGRKLPRDKGHERHDSSKRDYPKFNPECMLTSDYVTAYDALNAKRLHLARCTFEPAVNRIPPMLDPSAPEVIEEQIP